MILTELTQTCGACPSQWDGRLEDGRYLYARYRWGYLSVTTGKTYDDAVLGDELFGEQIGHGLDGTLSTEDMLRHAGLTLKEG